jgi:membrane protein
MLLKKAIRIIIIFKNAHKSFRGNDPLRMGAATAFFAFFALPAIVIILSKVLSVVFSNQEGMISGKLFEELSQLFGSRSAHQVENISENLKHIPQSPLFTLIGSLFLILSSTTLFAVIKGSLNQLWNIKEKPLNSWLKFLMDRAIGLSIIIFSGFLFITSLLMDRLTSLIQHTLFSLMPHFNFPLVSVLNYILSVLVITLWFAVLFKYLPDIKIRWKAVLIGALVTSILYKVGEFVLERLLINGQAVTIFGSSASIVFILLFIFYSSLIFYFGAAFTKTYAGFAKLGHVPNLHSVAYQITEIEIDKSLI